MAEQLWKPAEIAALMKVEGKTVTRWAASGRLPAIRTPGGHYRVPDAAVRELWQSEGGGPDGG